MAKRFFFVSTGVLCLMLAALIGFHMGNHAAQAQAPGTIHGYAVDSWVSASGHHVFSHYVILSDGNIYQQGESLNPNGPSLVGNFWGGGTVPTNQSTWGVTKQQFKPKD